jgi:hypothetical protein
MHTLVIDDLRNVRDPEADVTYARTPDEGVRLLRTEHWDLVCLDHDLGIERRTGRVLDIWPCVEFIEENPERFTETNFYIVTSNPWGAERMHAALRARGLYAYRIDHREKDRLFSGSA